MALAPHTTHSLLRHPNPRRMRAALVAVVAVAVAASLALVLRDGSSSTSTRVREAPTAAPATAPVPTGSPTPTVAPAVTTPATAAWHFGYQPLWPFATASAAEAWRTSATKDAHPWHASADETALMFTQVFLKFTGLDLVTSHTGTANDAHIGVGGPTEGNLTSTAAIVHLVRFGPAADAPWEVVGTDDTTLSLTNPAYGSTVGATFSVGGRISGVDESVHLQVLQSTLPGLLADRCCLAAGGTNQPWSTSVSIRGATDPVATVVAWTGGHVRAVERFAVTAVRPA